VRIAPGPHGTTHPSLQGFLIAPHTGLAAPESLSRFAHSNSEYDDEFEGDDEFEDDDELEDDDETLAHPHDQIDVSETLTEEGEGKKGVGDGSQMILLTNGNTLALIDPLRPSTAQVRLLGISPSGPRGIWPFLQVPFPDLQCFTLTSNALCIPILYFQVSASASRCILYIRSSKDDG